MHAAGSNAGNVNSINEELALIRKAGSSSRGWAVSQNRAGHNEKDQPNPEAGSAFSFLQSWFSLALAKYFGFVLRFAYTLGVQD